MKIVPKFADRLHGYVTSHPSNCPLCRVEKWLERLYDEPLNWMVISSTDAQTIVESLNRSDWHSIMTFTEFMVNLLRRIMLIRAKYLTEGMIAEVNQGNVATVPLIVRSLLEDCAWGVYADSRLRELYSAGMERKQDHCDFNEFVDLQFKLIFGSRINAVTLDRRVFEHFKDLKPNPTDYANFYVQEFLNLVKEGNWENRESGSKETGWFAINILTMIDKSSKARAEVWPAEVRGNYEKEITAVYGLLSQYCHPSVNSWAQVMKEVFEGKNWKFDEFNRYDREITDLIILVGILDEYLRDVFDDAYGKLGKFLSTIHNALNMPHERSDKN